MKEEEITYDDVIELRSAVKIGSVPEAREMITPCKLAVISNTAVTFLDIVLSEMNKKGRFGLFSAFTILPKVIKAVIVLIAQYKSCKE